MHHSELHGSTVIGGADGPTAIFLGGGLPIGLMLMTGAALLLAVVLFVVFWGKNRQD